ncbi:MAG: hypothetical protein NTZ48_00415 [Candidatus Omnitrophica bacterium]|nr:hypothetical protein [Candidatus Omnitrophota bacterium]
MIKIKSIVFGLFIIILALTSINSEAFLDQDPGVTGGRIYCPPAASLSGEEVITDYNKLIGVVGSLRGILFSNLGIDPNTPVADLGTLGKEIQPILDILNNPRSIQRISRTGQGCSDARIQGTRCRR